MRAIQFPETLMMEPRGRGVLDTRMRGYDEVGSLMRKNLGRRRPRMRAIQYSRDIDDGAEGPQRTGYPACAGYDKVGSTDPPDYAAT